jgi:hypothetical protein
MEKIMLEQKRKSYNQYKPLGLKKVCKKLNLYFCSITEKNKKEKIEYIIKYEQKSLKKDIKKLLEGNEIDYGFLVKMGSNYFYSITDDYTYIIIGKKILKFINDKEYDNYFSINGSYNNIIGYNAVYKRLNKLIGTNEKLIDIKRLKKISNLLSYKNLMGDQYNELENYFSNNKFPNQLENNIIEGFVHNLEPHILEFILKSGNHKFINPISGRTYNSERGVYTTLRTSNCHVSRFMAGSNPALVFSKELANDFGYIFNFNFNYGVVNNESYIKGQTFIIKGKKYSAVEKGTIVLCKKKLDERQHEVVFYTDHIKLKDYLEAIVFSDEEQYKLFKNMKGIKFKNKMILKK